MTAVSEQKEQPFLNDLLEFRENVPVKSSLLHEFSQKAVGDEVSLRAPTTKDEEWKYTNLRTLYRERFIPWSETENSTISAELENYLIPEAGGARLVFVNGTYNEALSSGEALPAAVKLTTLSVAAEKYPELLEKHMGNHAIIEKDPFIPFNSAFLQDGIFLHIPKDTSVDTPIHLLFISTDSAENYFEVPRCLIVCDSYSKGTVVEDYLGVGETSYLTVPVTEISLGEGASLKHIRWQRDGRNAFHINRVGASLSKYSHYDSYSFQLGSRISRNDVYSFLDDEEIDCTLDGLVLVGDDQLSDTHTKIDHRMPHCTSHQLHKCIIEGSGHSVFNGKIYVHKDAQKTDSFQENRNLLLSRNGRVDTKPQLEIFADDVKCSHGATVGQLEEDEVFYLKSRGLSEETARELLSYGFALEIIENISIESVRKQLTIAVKKFTQKTRELASTV